LNRVFIERFGVCSALGENLASHVEVLKNKNLNAPISKINIKESADEYELPYYKAKTDFDTFLGQIGEICKDTALFVGSSSLGVELNEKEYASSGIKVLGYDMQMPKICEKLNIKSYNRYLFCTACTSSANALTYAAKMIKAGIIKSALVLGVEVPNRLSLYGFMSLGLLSKSAILPFDKKRDGIVLGEGYGFVLLSNKKSEWEFVNGESQNDIASITSPSIDGRTLSNVVTKILKDAKLKPKQIDLIKLHATASDSNDISENAGICKIFQKIPTAIALKGYMGHTLGACGICELAFLLGALEKNIAPKSMGFEQKDESFDISPTTKNEFWNGSYILLNHLAFGGNTTSILIKKNKS
jgi:3-oxoacyl-[acyl-carrier-protein] synthase-1